MCTSPSAPGEARPPQDAAFSGGASGAGADRPRCTLFQDATLPHLWTLSAAGAVDAEAAPVAQGAASRAAGFLALRDISAAPGAAACGICCPPRRQGD
mmetsp:Transcript_17508/g.38563  ORF Transcript_17508/g.38563 Transcript_17508/m.38563 type:complete len:98 (-) Transcript_17508:110-403(-)